MTSQAKQNVDGEKRQYLFPRRGFPPINLLQDIPQSFELNPARAIRREIEHCYAQVASIQDRIMLFNALIRTHHITSRKKVSALKRAADVHNCFVLLRSGGCPGIMYVEGQEKDAVESWVNVVRNLRYKDFQLVTRPGVMADETQSENRKTDEQFRSLKNKRYEVGLSEVETVKEFGSMMEQRGVWQWWRKGMGYLPEER